MLARAAPRRSILPGAIYTGGGGGGGGGERGGGDLTDDFCMYMHCCHGK